MESLSRPAAAGIPPDEEPRWWPVIVGVFTGYLWALLVLGGVAIGLTLLGVIVWSSGPRGDDWLAGPFEPNGPWSLFTDAVVAFSVLAATSGFVIWAVSNRVHRRVSWTVAFLSLGVTGYAPYFLFEGRLRLSGVIGLLLSAAAIRDLGISGARPADLLAGVEDRVIAAVGGGRRLVFTLAVAWAAVVGVGVAYGVTHPIRMSGGYGSGNVRTIGLGDDTEYHVYRGKPGATRRIFITLQNNGFADIHDVRVEAGPGGALRLEPIVVAPSDGTIAGRDERGARLAFAFPSCGVGARTLSLLRVRYTVFGRPEDQLLRLDPPIAARCAKHGR